MVSGPCVRHQYEEQPQGGTTRSPQGEQFVAQCEGSMGFKLMVEMMVSGTCLCLLWLSVPVGEYYKSHDCRELLCEGDTVFCSLCALTVLIITQFVTPMIGTRAFLLLTNR